MFEGAVGLERAERLVDAGQQLAALLHQQAELLGRTGGLNCPDDRALRDLDGGDVERRRQVGDDRVDLAVEQRLLAMFVFWKTSGY